MTTPRPIFLNRFYRPDEPATAQLLTDLAEALAARGFDPLVITSLPVRPDIAAEDRLKGVTIRRVRGTRWDETRVASKAVNFVTFYLAALWRLFLTARRGDVITAMTDPPLLGIGVWLIARLRGARVVHWVQDIYPEIAIALGAPRPLALVTPLRNLAWRQADACVTLGADMAALLAQAGVQPSRIHVIPNAAPAGVTRQPSPGNAAQRNAWQLAGKFVVEYSGNLGRVHALDPVLEVARILQTDPRIAFLVVGDGAQRAALGGQVQRQGIRNVQFQPAQPREKLNASLGVGDVHLVTLHPACARYVFPSKLHGIAAIGRPAIYIGPLECDVARVITSHRFGYVFDPTDTAGVAETLRRLAGDAAECARLADRAVAFAASTSGTLEQWAQLLRQVGVPARAAATLAESRIG